jgi:hypothetical protein
MNTRLCAVVMLCSLTTCFLHSPCFAGVTMLPCFSSSSPHVKRLGSWVLGSFFSDCKTRRNLKLTSLLQFLPPVTMLYLSVHEGLHSSKNCYLFYLFITKQFISGDKVSNFYSGSTGFEFRPGHRTSWFIHAFPPSSQANVLNPFPSTQFPIRLSLISLPPNTVCSERRTASQNRP